MIVSSCLLLLLSKQRNSYDVTLSLALIKNLCPDSTGLWKCVGKLPDAHALPIYYVDYAPARAGHGRIVSAGGDNRIQIYREALGSSSDQPLFSLDVAVTTDHGDVNCVCWHPQDGSMLASAGDDGAIRIWKYRTSS